MLGVWALYIICILVLRRIDQRDRNKIAPIALAENNDSHAGKYEVLISTGSWINAGTKSNVRIVLFGLYGTSEVRLLKHSWRPCFTRGSIDTFLLTTPTDIGPIVKIRISHDNSGGKQAGWFLNRVRVTNLISNDSKYFICGRWLALGEDDGRIEREISAARPAELDTFSNAFHDSFSQGFQDKHLWLSIITRPPRSRFTRIQRLTCVLQILFLSMLTSVMFYQTDGSELSFSQKMFVAVVSIVIVAPPVSITIFFFKSARLTSKSPKGGKHKGFLAGFLGELAQVGQRSSRQVDAFLTPFYFRYIAWTF